MARNKKVEILSNDKEVLHPMTDGDCVIFEDGQTLAQKLSEDDSVKYTPEIVNSSPMFKVGEGNTVDYSDNVLDGAYERATLQGQTYVNYIQESSADEVTLPTPFTEYERTQHNTLTSNEEGTLGINLVGQSYVNALQHDSEEEYVVLGESLEFQEKKVEYTNEGQIKSAMLKGQTLVNLALKDFKSFTASTDETANEPLNKYRLHPFALNMVQPNKEYYLIVHSKYVSGDESANNMRIVQQKANEDGTKSWLTERAYLPDANGWFHIRFTTVNECNRIDLSMARRADNGVHTSTYIYSSGMLIEYQDGMENWDIPYFEGMQSVTVSTRLENLCHRHNKNSITKTGKTFTVLDYSTRTIDIFNSEQAATVFKPNTKYLIQFTISNLVLDGIESIPLLFSNSNISAGNSLFGDASQYNVSQNGVHRIIRTTTHLIGTSNCLIKGLPSEWEKSGSSLRSMTISEIMYVEYQNGMENWDLPYFEDYQVMKPVQVESVNKNLFNGELELGGYTGTTGGKYDGTDRVRSTTKTFLKAGTYYLSSSNATKIAFNLYNMDNTFRQEHAANSDGVKLILEKEAYSHITVVTPNLLNAQIQLEESDTATEYIPHQSKTTYSWDEVILRKIGDVEDTLDLTTGEWVQRIGHFTFDGSDDEGWELFDQDYTGWSTYLWRCKLGVDVIGQAYEYDGKKIICDRFVFGALTDNQDYEHYRNNGYDADGISYYFYVWINKEKATTIEELKNYLKHNPINMEQQLVTPIVRKVNLSRPNLQVYDDITHIHTKCLDGTLIPNIYLPSDISYPAILEPNKKYNVCVNHTEVSADNPLKVNVGGTEITMTDSRMTLTTPTTLVNSNVSFTGKGNKIKESMLIKNSSLLTRDLPHFNGIGSVQLGKTIENLCGSKHERVGSGGSTQSETDDSITITVTKQGSVVCCFELTTLLENGKKYFVYCPSSITTTITSKIQMGFKRTYNGITGYLRQPTGTSRTQYMIDQVDNQYTHLTVGCHGTLNIGDVYTIQRPIICEYEQGMENWDWESIGYFTGTKNIGNEFMRVQNKNFYPYGDSSFTGQQGNTWCWLNGKGCSFGASCIKKNMGNVFYLKKGSYVLSYNDNNSFQTKTIQLVGEYEKMANFKNIEQDGWYALRIKTTKDNIPVNITNIQIEESSTATSYTAHKHNGLYVTKDQPINLTWEQGRINPSGIGDSYTNATNNAVSYGIRTKGLLNLKPNTTYRISLGDKVSFKYHIAVFDNSNNALPSVASLGINGDWVSSTDTIFTTTKDAHKIGINVQKQNASSITSPESVHAQVRLEEVTDVVLRSCSGKYDELDLTRGVYTQNVGVVYMDGVNQHSNYITVVGDSYQPTDTTLKTFDIRCDGAVFDSICLSNKFPMRESMTSTEINFESVRIHSTNSSCRLTIKKEKASTLEEFKLWLQDNPLEIIYALKTPIVHQVHIGNKNEANTEVTKPNDVFTLPTLYTEQTHIDLTNNGIIPKVQSRDYIAYPVSPMINRTYTLQHNLTGGVSNLTVDLLGRTQSVSYQNHKSLVYTPETILHNELRISGKGKIGRVMYIDGGYMDRDIPYIEGMKNAVNPIVKNIGKNLMINEFMQGYYNGEKNGLYVDNHSKFITTSNLIPVRPNTYYIQSCSLDINNGAITFFDKNKKYISQKSNILKSSFITPPNCYYLAISWWENNGLNSQSIEWAMLEESSTPSQYEPYKENICYVDCGEIRLTPDMFEQGSITVHVNNIGKPYTVALNSDKARIRTKKPINIEPNEQYVIIGNTDKYGYSLHFLDKDENYIGVKAPYELSWGGHKPFTVASDSPKALVFIKRMDNSTITPNDVDAFNFQLVKVSEIKQMRSLPHGVHDEIDLETGKYIQRVGEITFNGIENWQPGYSSWDNKCTYWNHDFVDIKLMKGDNGSGQAYYDAVRCSQLHRSYMGRLASALIDGVCSYYYSGYQRIFISKQDCATVNELKLWLQENPITVQYELPKPIVKDIVIHNYPHSYEDGHVIIENGDPNTPIPAQLTYRAVTNRSGQIQQHTEQVEKQEREINELETLILANIHLNQTR